MDQNMSGYLESAPPADCPTQKGSTAKQLEQRVADRKFNVYFTMTSNMSDLKLDALGVLEKNDYERYLSERSGAGYKGISKYNSFQKLETAFKNTHPNIKYDSLSFADKEKYLSEYLAKNYGATPPSGSLVQVMAYNKLIADGGNWKKYLNEAQSLLTTQQKITLVSEFGNKFAALYNYNRADGGPDGTFVSMEQLLLSAKKGTRGGICRDIALAQTQMLGELGFKNSYVVAYKTADAGHATVISEDPETGKIVKFNYGEVSESKANAGTDVLAMNSSLPDHTLAYRIYDKNGKPVTSVPSQLTQVLRDATNHKDKLMFDKRYQVGKIGFESSNGHFGGNLFAGETSTGEQIYGGALYAQEQAKHFKADFGLAYAKSKKENDYYYMESDQIYARFHGELDTPSLKIKQTETSLFVGADVDIALANNKDKAKKGLKDVEGKKQTEVRNAFEAGLRSNGSFNNGETEVKAELFAASYVDWDHVAKEGKKTLVYDGTVLNAGLKQKVTQDMFVMADTAVLVRNYGSSLVADVGLENPTERYKVYVGGRTPLSSDHPSFLPGGEKVARLGGKKETKSGLYFTFELEKDLNSSNTSATLNAGKKF